MSLTQTPVPELGKPCPDFSLHSVSGKIYSKADFFKGKPVVVMFICNHCPYIIAIEDRLIKLGMDLQMLEIPLVAINSNDAKSYPEDSFAGMQKKANDKRYTFVYLHDETQQVARDFGAVCTPDFFVYDKNGLLAYRGRLDDSWKEADKVTKRELFEAVRKLDQGSRAPSNQTPSMGCSLKWKT